MDNSTIFAPKCAICGAPARYRQYTKITGMVVIFYRSLTKSVPYWDNHKSSVGMKVNIHNFIFGWWGIKSLIYNIGAIVSNATGGTDMTEKIQASARIIMAELEAKAVQTKQQPQATESHESPITRL